MFRKRYKRRFKRKRSTKRRYGRKRYARRRYRLSRMRPGNRKDTETVKLRYAYSTVVSHPGPGGGVWYFPTFRANSIFDPHWEIAPTDTTAFDYARFSDRYNKYIVLGSKIKYTLLRGNGDIVSHVFMTKLDDDGQSFNLGDKLYRWYADPTVRKQHFNLNSNMRSQLVATRYYSPRKFFGFKDTRDNFARHGAAVDANPAETVCFCAGMQAADLQQETPFTITLIVEIDYLVQFREPKDYIFS